MKYLKTKNVSASAACIGGLVLGLFLSMMFPVACTEPESARQGSVSDFAGLENFVIARVGETDIYLTDLLFSLPGFGYLHQGLITVAIYEEEAKARKVYPSNEKIMEFYNRMIEQQGGVEQFLMQFPPVIPKQAALKAMKQQSLQQAVQQAILDDEYMKKHGAPTEEEVTQMWEERKENWKSVVSSRENVKPEEVTMEMARKDIEEAIKNQWMGMNASQFLENLTKNYPVENLMLNYYNSINPEDVKVPEIEKETDESSTPEDEPHEDTTPVGEEEPTQ